MRSVRSWSAHLTAWRDRMPPRSLLGPRASPGSSVWVNRFPVRSEDQLMSDPGPTGPGFAVPIMLEPKHGTWFGALAWRDAKAMHRCVRLGPLCLGLVAPVSSPGGLRGALYKTRACPRMRGTPRPVLSEHRFTGIQCKG